MQRIYLLGRFFSLGQAKLRVRATLPLLANTLTLSALAVRQIRTCIQFTRSTTQKNDFFDVFNTEGVCGQVKNQQSERIVGGVEAVPHEFPWSV